MFKNLNILRPILAILILFIPLYPKFPLTTVKGTYVAIRLDDIIVVLSLAIWLIYQIRHRFPVFKLKINRLFLVYFLAIIASNLTALLIYQTTSPNLLMLHLLRRFEYISLFFLATSAINSKKDLTFAYYFLILVTFLVSLYGYGQKYFHFDVISTMNEEFSKGQLLQMDSWSRINSTFAGHYDLAAFMSFVLVIILGASLISPSKITRLFGFLVFLVGFHVLTLTASRISTFAFWGGAVLVLILIKRYLWIIPVSALVVFSILNSKDLNQRLLATIPALQQQLSRYRSSSPTTAPTITPTPTPIVIAVVPTVPSGPKVIKPTLAPTPTIFRHQNEEEFPPLDADIGVARSGEIRFNIEWPRAITAFQKNRLTGTGLGSITLATDNDYLRLLGESGLFGFISLMVIILYFFYQTIFINSNRYSLILLASLLSFLANAVFIDVFEASKTAYIFWLVMGVYYQTLQWPKKSSS